MMPGMEDDYSCSNADLGALYAAHFRAICQRHDTALERAGAAHAVIFSGAPRLAFLDDQAYPFVANPHFLAWAPLPAMPMSYIVYTPGDTPIMVYFQPQDYWHVVPDAPAGYWTRHFDIRVVHQIEDIPAQLPEHLDKCILIGDITDPAQTFGIDRVNPTVAMNILHYARAAKTAYEIACMRLASRRAARGHLAAEAAFRAGASEFGINQAYTAAVEHTDNELPYANIIAINRHAAVLHYTNLDRSAPGTTRSLLIDAGAQVHSYAADITRTYAFDDTEFGALIDRMDTMQREIVARVRTGVSFTDLHLATHHLLADLLVDAGLASGEPSGLLSAGVTTAFFPHGLGHLIGLQVHDVGGRMAGDNGAIADPPSGHPFLRMTRRLEENVVVTIEPGLYAIDMLLDNLRGTPAEKLVNWERVAWLRPFGGIRIEDNVRVTAGDAENLTRDAFSALG